MRNRLFIALLVIFSIIFVGGCGRKGPKESTGGGETEGSIGFYLPDGYTISSSSSAPMDGQNSGTVRDLAVGRFGASSLATSFSKSAIKVEPSQGIEVVTKTKSFNIIGAKEKAYIVTIVDVLQVLVPVDGTNKTQVEIKTIDGKTCEYDIFQPVGTDGNFKKKSLSATAADLTGSVDKISLTVKVDGVQVAVVTDAAGAKTAIALVDEKAGTTVAEADLPKVIQDDIEGKSGEDVDYLEIVRPFSHVLYDSSGDIDGYYLAFEANFEMVKQVAEKKANYTFYREKKADDWVKIEDDDFIDEISLTDSNGETKNCVAFLLNLVTAKNDYDFEHGDKYRIVIAENFAAKEGQVFEDEDARTVDIEIDLEPPTIKKISGKIVDPKGLKSKVAIAGDTIEITVEFDREVMVDDDFKGVSESGKPHLVLKNLKDSDGTAVTDEKAVYSDDDNEKLVFTYVVTDNLKSSVTGTDIDPLNIKGTAPLAFNGGFILGSYNGIRAKLANLNDALVDLTGTKALDNSGLKVDSILPKVVVSGSAIGGADGLKGVKIAAVAPSSGTAGTVTYSGSGRDISIVKNASKTFNFTLFFEDEMYQQKVGKNEASTAFLNKSGTAGTTYYFTEAKTAWDKTDEVLALSLITADTGEIVDGTYELFLLDARNTAGNYLGQVQSDSNGRHVWKYDNGASTPETYRIVVKKKVVTAITVTTQPTNLSYAEGDTLDLDGLKVKLTYSDGSEDTNLAHTSFADKGITANPAHGTILTNSGHNGKPIVLTCNGLQAQTDNLTVTALSP